MAFYTQGILYCWYIGTAQVHVASLKFYMQTALRTTSHGKNVSGSNMQVASVSSLLAKN